MPVKSLWDMWQEEEEVVIDLIKPGLLHTGGLMVITGEPGSGKSWLVQQMAFELATGRRFLGLFPVQKSVVCIIETEKQSPVARARWMDPKWRQEYGDEAGANIGYYDDDIPNLANPSGRRIIESMIKQWQPDIFIVDSFANTTFDERELDKMKSTILNYRGLARDYEIPFAMIQHLNKRAKAFSGKQDGFVESVITMNDLRGSKYLQYEVDTVIAMTKDPSSPSVKNIGFLKHSFCPIQLQDMAPLKFKFMPHTVKPFQHDERYPEILNLMDQGMNTYSALEEALHMSRPTLRKIIAGMTELGLIKPIEGGKGAHDVTQIIPTALEMKLDE